MEKKIASFINDLKSNKKLAAFDTASTKQAIVLRLLSFLGWDIFNVEQVYPDYSVSSSNVSYALRIKNTNKVFIEVKRVHSKLYNHQKSLVNLASREGVNLAEKEVDKSLIFIFFALSIPTSEFMIPYTIYISANNSHQHLN